MKIHTKQYSSAYWRVIIDNPPINIFDQEMAEDIHTVLNKLEADEAVKVVVFESANPDYFMATADWVGARWFDEKPEPAGTVSLPYLLKRMNRSQFLTIGILRGHARGAGSEFLLGLDIRFASREQAVLSQIDLGTEFSNVKGGFERLCDLVGRARALEIILGSEDLNADLAERLSLINRSIQDENLDEFVDRFASNISKFDREYIALIKQVTGEQIGLATVLDTNETPGKSFETSKWSKIQERIASPVERIWHKQGNRDFPLGEQLRPDYDL
jgi:enoyl-CoA hydratase/carnithine racemase